MYVSLPCVGGFLGKFRKFCALQAIKINSRFSSYFFWVGGGAACSYEEMRKVY